MNQPIKIQDKSPKLSQRISKRYHKTLGTSVIDSRMVCKDVNLLSEGEPFFCCVGHFYCPLSYLRISENLGICIRKCETMKWAFLTNLYPKSENAFPIYLHYAYKFIKDFLRFKTI